MVIWDILKGNLDFVSFWTAKVNGPLDGLYLFVPIFFFFFLRNTITIFSQQILKNIRW